MRIPFKIVTERLIIRCYHPSDVDLLQSAITNSLENLRKWMPWAMGEPTTREEKKELLSRFESDFVKSVDYVFGIFNKTEDVLIGSTGLHTRQGADIREIGYWINSDFLNKGYATEAVMALITAGFQYHFIKHIEIHCDPDNLISHRIPKKLGFKLAETLKKNAVSPNNEPRDTMIWKMTQEQYQQRKLEFPEITLYDKDGVLMKS